MQDLRKSVQCALERTEGVIKFGYYFGISAYGSYLQQLHEYTTFTFCEAGWTTDWGYHGSEERFVVHLNKAKRLGFDIHLNFQWDPHQGSHFADTCRLACPVWDAVELVDLRDEPAGPLAPAVNDLRGAIKDAGLKTRPIGAVFNQQEMLSGRARMTSLDWVGIEAYVNPIYQNSLLETITEMRRVVRAQLAFIPPDKRVVVVGQAYDRNGKWLNIGTLKTLQMQTYLEARRDPRVTHLRWFSYGRRGGTLDHPSLIPRHKAIVRKDAIT